MHRREGHSSPDALSDPHQQQSAVVQTSHDRRQESADDVDGNREEHHPFGTEALGHCAAGQLSHDVTPEVGAEDCALEAGGPEERTVLESSR